MKKISYLLIILFSFIGCSSTVKKDNEQQDKVSIMRFDRDLNDYIQNPATEKESALKSKYPALLPALGQITINQLAANDPAFFPDLREYFSHAALQKIYKDALKTFDNTTSYEEELTKANALIAENLSGASLPQLAMHVSGFKENVIILNNMISISTDKYLGSNYPAYQEFFAPYQRQQMTPKMVVRDYLKAWIMSDIIKSDNDDQETLLSAMVEEGKILYILSVLLPDYNANDLIGYTADQTKWCVENEKSVWQTMIKQSNIYTSDHMIITRYVNDAPYTSTLSLQSPGRVGAWVGWQIVFQYAKKTNASIQDIITLDPQEILKESKYNP
ncbi:hypothetical protein [Dysgonomonas sp. ZJ709]|uniref:gliding motility lipoprotein GldB n=1 Tax=Dysgonomonas sp. ZJ709 TaxID=2709797 RepID=UPI0013ED4384|nr:hypothetical protein [Dysgonomonas sp. ZJ709]